MEESFNKYVPKTRLIPLFSFGNNPKQPLHARNSFQSKLF